MSEHSFLKWVLKSKHLRNIADGFNRLLMSRFGIRVTAQPLAEDWSAATRRRLQYTRVLYFQRLFNLLQDIEGDIVECGVAKGATLAMLARMARSSGTSRHIWGFDSFGGLLTPTIEDLDSTETYAEKEKFKASVNDVITSLRLYGFDDQEISNWVTIVEGLFSETLPKYGGSQIALLHIDCNLYRAHMEALRYLWPKVAVGGIATFDDYHVPQLWPGAKRAVDEYFSSQPPESVRLECDTLFGFGRYYAIKRG